jgi:IclR family transcriptional regulator, KDG regulon repressor
LSSQSVQSVNRALRILEILRGFPNGLGVTEISIRLDVAKSTAHRLLSSLMEEGFVQKDQETERYRLGLKLLQLGYEVSKSMDIRRVAAPFMERLVDLTGETVHLAIYDHGEIVYIDKLESKATIRMYSRVGLRAHSHCTGLGKAILSCLPREEMDLVIEKYGLPKFTETTLITRETLMEALDAAKDIGYAFDDEEHEEGVRCAAAPIFNFEKTVIAGISVAGPITRISQERLKTMGLQVKQIALEISREMGY